MKCRDKLYCVIYARQDTVLSTRAKILFNRDMQK